MKKTEELQIVQDYLTGRIIEEIKDKFDFDQARLLLGILESVDTDRRKAWHDEKFGPYEDIVNEFSVDDIPF